MFGQVEGWSAFPETLNRPGVVGGIGRDADADGRPQHPVADAHLEIADARADALGDAGRPVQVGLGQEHAELFAAVATGMSAARIVSRITSPTF